MSVLSGRHGYYNTSVYNLWRNIIKRCEVTNWAEMPKYKGKDVGND